MTTNLQNYCKNNVFSPTFASFSCFVNTADQSAEADSKTMNMDHRLGCRGEMQDQKSGDERKPDLSQLKMHKKYDGEGEKYIKNDRYRYFTR